MSPWSLKIATPVVNAIPKKQPSALCSVCVSSSLVLQGLGPTSESLATNTALVRLLVLSAGSSATSNGWWQLC